MAKLFRAAKQNRIFQDVVDQIQEAIIDGHLKSGDRLPAERELKEMLQTSRSTVREALRVLEHMGLIEIRLGTGGGAIVKAVTSEQVTESLDLLIRSQKVSLDDLAEFRESIEGDVVVIAAGRADGKDIKRLRTFLEKAGNYMEKGPTYVERFLLEDKKFHLCFAEITKNPVFISVLKTIHDNMHRYYEKFLTMKQKEMEENFSDLRAIVEAVEEGKAEKAGELARMHVRRFNTYMTGNWRGSNFSEKEKEQGGVQEVGVKICGRNQ